ncbi:MAG: hypothetical protein QXQ94_08455 [Candidatus Bathyarchaeia archaeon]
MNLWILTEERPKKKVVEMLLNKLGEDRQLRVTIDKIGIMPIVKEERFSFTYQVTGASVESIDNIFLKIVSGDSSFVDFLVFLQEKAPEKDSVPIYAVEETKTADIESRNTGVYQRCSKFVFLDFYYPNCRKIMLYNLQIDSQSEPTQTNIFGTRMLMTIGVEILGKTLEKDIFKPFQSVDEFIEFKSKMRNPPAGNVPISINKFNDRIEVSGRLFKSGSLSHDPNIGALSIIAKTLRVLGWDKDIIITKHGLSQEHVNPGNKFVKIASKLNVKLDKLTMPKPEVSEEYWHYEKNSEKIATIFLHLILEDMEGIEVIYENHAGCERGYFKTQSGDCIAIHKYIENEKVKGILNIPDLIVCDKSRKQILILEGKPHDNLTAGLDALKRYGHLQREYIERYYPGYTVSKHVVLFGGYNSRIMHPEVAFLLNSNGDLILAEHTPDAIKNAVKELLKK